MWYDTALGYTEDCLKAFTEEDWNKLFSELPTKSLIWQDRFLDCLNDPNDQNQLKALLILSTTDDLQLFTYVISALLAYDVSGVEDIDKLFEKVEQLMPLVGETAKKEFSQFLEKKKQS